MANSQNSADLLRDALGLVGELPDGSSDYTALALKFLNDAYLAVLAGSNEFQLDIGEPWVFARNSTPKSFVLLPAYSDGTVSLTNASAAGTFSSAPSASLGSFANRYIKVNDRASYYQITEHVAGASAFTLDRAYLEATGGTLAFTAIPLIYNLGSGILRLVEPFRVFGNTRGVSGMADDDGRIYGIPLNNLREQWPLQYIRSGMPNRFATYRRDDNSWYVMVNAYPDEPTKVDFDCIDIPAGLTDSDSSVPLIPREFRKVLSYGAAYFLSIKKEASDEKKQELLALTQAKLKAMMKAEMKETTVAGKDKGRLFPRQEELRNGGRLRGYY